MERTHRGNQLRKFQLRRRLILRKPFHKHRVWQRNKAFKAGYFIRAYLREICIGKTPQDQIHLLGAAMRGTIGSSTAAHFQIIIHRQNALSWITGAVGLTPWGAPATLAPNWPLI